MSEIDWVKRTERDYAAYVGDEHVATAQAVGPVQGRKGWLVYCRWIPSMERHYPECERFANVTEAKRAVEDSYAVAKIGGQT